MKNLIKYPLGWVFVFTWICVCVGLMSFFYYMTHYASENQRTMVQQYCKCHDFTSLQDEPLIANKALLVATVVKKDKKLMKHNLKYRRVQELLIFQDDKYSEKSFLYKFLILWKLNLQNDHLWLGICCRDHGTHYTHMERICIMMVCGV